MPSFIYIARITRSSEELAQGLRSAGLHVKSFAPGEITADECLLAITSEAVLASLQPAHEAPRAGHAAETRQELEDVPPPPNMNAHLGSQAATWNRLKTAAAKESATSRERPSPVASKIESEPENLGFIPSEVGLRALAISQKSAETSQPLPVAQAGPSAKTGNPSFSPLSLPKDRSRIGPAQNSAISFGKASRLGRSNRWVNGPRYSLLWQTVAIAASMLIFAATRPSTTDVTAGDTNQSTQFDSDSKESTQTVSGLGSGPPIQPPKSPVTRSSTEAPKAGGAQRQQSDYDFVAEDFTNHFDLHAPSIAVLQNSELKRNAQGSVKRKRVVVN
jgi:hypothetical protein